MTSGMWNQPEPQPGQGRRMAATGRMGTVGDLVRLGLGTGVRVGSAALRRLRGRGATPAEGDATPPQP